MSEARRARVTSGGLYENVDARQTAFVQSIRIDTSLLLEYREWRDGHQPSEVVWGAPMLASSESREMFQRNANEEEDVCAGEDGGYKQVKSEAWGYGKGKSGEWIMVLCVGRLFLWIAYR